MFLLSFADPSLPYQRISPASVSAFLSIHLFLFPFSPPFISSWVALCMSVGSKFGSAHSECHQCHAGTRRAGVPDAQDVFLEPGTSLSFYILGSLAVLNVRFVMPDLAHRSPLRGVLYFFELFACGSC